MIAKKLIDLRWVKSSPMAGVETYAKLGARSFINRSDTVIFVPRKNGFEDFLKGDNVVVDKYYALNNVYSYIYWMIGLAWNYHDHTIITFNYYNPLFNRRTLNTIMDLRLLDEGVLQKSFFTLNVLCSFSRYKRSYAISPYVQKMCEIKLGLKVDYIPTLMETNRETENSIITRENFALIISSDLSHKNLGIIYEIGEDLPIDVVIIGPSQINDYAQCARIIHLGFVSKEQKNALIRNSKFLIFPTLAEGFGYPILDAALFGKRILCNKLEVFISLFGDYPIYVNSTDVNSWKRALHSEVAFHSLPENKIEIVDEGIDSRLAKYFCIDRFVKDIIDLVE